MMILYLQKTIRNEDFIYFFFNPIVVDYKYVVKFMERFLGLGWFFPNRLDKSLGRIPMGAKAC